MFRGCGAAGVEKIFLTVVRIRFWAPESPPRLDDGAIRCPRVGRFLSGIVGRVVRGGLRTG